MAFSAEMRELAQALIAQGMTKEDSATAVHLAWLIRGLDMHTFPAWPGVVECLSKSHPDHFIAGYDDESRDPERYLVYAEGIHRTFVADCLDMRFVRGHGPGTKFPSLLERLASVAVHEVRHRLQRRLAGDLRMWTPCMKRSGLVAGVLDRVRAEHHERILQAKVQRRDKAMAGHLKEFDALVVEYYALHHIHAVNKPEDLVEFVWLES